MKTTLVQEAASATIEDLQNVPPVAGVPATIVKKQNSSLKTSFDKSSKKKP